MSKASRPVSVVVKLQRPIFTNGGKNEVLSYLVDDDLEQISNDLITTMDKKTIKELFGEYYKVFYLGAHVDGQPVALSYPLIPMYKEEWV